MRMLAVLCVRNEGAFLLEWLAHHRVVGFTDFLILSNDCDDGTDAMLDRLAAMGEIAHLPNPAPHNGGVQWVALKRAGDHPLVKRARWIMAFDVDEFVNIHVGDHRLADLLQTLPEATAIPLTWRLFGNPGITRFVDEPITAQFKRAAPKVMFWPWRAAMFKTLFKNDGTYAKLGVHRPQKPDSSRLPKARWFDGSGREMADKFKRQQTFSPFGQDNYQLAQLNHYPLGAMQSFIIKRDRGRAVHALDRLGMSYWVERNWCDDVDTSIGALANQSQAELARLKADVQLSGLHDTAVAWRHERFISLMAEEENRALFGRLLMTPPSRALTIDEARDLFARAQSRAKPTD